MARSEQLRGLWRSERPFVVAFALAAFVRILLMVAFPPAFLMSDGPTYLGFVDHLFPSPDRPVGYGVYLRVLSWTTRSVELVSATQLVLGLLTGLLGYVLLRRWGVSSWVATLATLPVLFDALQLMLEHSVLSDVLFGFLLMLGVASLAWWREPRLWTTAVAGLVLGSATLVRIIGEPTVAVAVLFLLLAATTWRARLTQALVVVVAFAVPVTAYAAWYHQENGAFALTQASGRALYMRTTSFVDCSLLTLPSYEQTLCPGEPLGDRFDPTWYGWHDPNTVHNLHLPPGVTAQQAMRDFARRAIEAQPADYLRVVARDAALPFIAVHRDDRYEYSTAVKWDLSTYVDYRPTPLWTGPAFAAHGGEMPVTRHPLGDWFATYGRWVYVPGPLLLVLLVVAVAGLVVRRPGTPSARPLAVLLLVLPLTLVLVPDVSAEFVWRYQLPLFVLLPMSAALGWTRLRAPRGVGADPAPTGGEPATLPGAQNVAPPPPDRPGAPGR